MQALWVLKNGGTHIPLVGSSPCPLLFLWKSCWIPAMKTPANKLFGDIIMSHFIYMRTQEVESSMWGREDMETHGWVLLVMVYVKQCLLLCQLMLTQLRTRCSREKWFPAMVMNFWTQQGFWGSSLSWALPWKGLCRSEILTYSDRGDRGLRLLWNT